MRNASENASSLIGLTLEMNRAAQAEITQEIGVVAVLKASRSETQALNRRTNVCHHEDETQETKQVPGPSRRSRGSRSRSCAPRNRLSIYHAITVSGRRCGAEEDEVLCRRGEQCRRQSSADLGEDRVRAVSGTRPTVSPAGARSSTPARHHGPGRSLDPGRIFNLLGELIDYGEPPSRHPSAGRSHREAPSIRGAGSDDRAVRDRMPGDRPARAACRAGRAVRRRRRRQATAIIQELIHNLAQEHGGAVGVLRRRRARRARQRPVAGDEGVRGVDKTMLVRADEKLPGARMRVALSGLTMAETPRSRGPGRAAVHRQHLPLRPGGLRRCLVDALPGDDERTLESRWASCRSGSHRPATAPRSRRSDVPLMI